MNELKALEKKLRELAKAFRCYAKARKANAKTHFSRASKGMKVGDYESSYAECMYGNTNESCADVWLEAASDLEELLKGA